MPKVTIISPTRPDDSGKIRVAAYCRVSTSTSEQHNSFTVQMEYFRNKFQYSDTEILVEVYADEGESGTSDQRENFKRMIKDCRRGRIDRIYAKSISRFARNTKDCLQYARELKAIGVSVVFEKEHIDTALMTDEMMLTIMSGLAQEESVSLSKNLKWSIRRKMQNGTYKTPCAPYGYTVDDGKLIISEPEAEVVRQIFIWYLNGYGIHRIVQMLDKTEISTDGHVQKWTQRHVLYILKNEKYIGDSLFQKKYMTDTVPFKLKENHGELPMYYVSGTHEGIISKEDFETAQLLLKQRRKGTLSERQHFPLAQRIVCGHCGKHFLRKASSQKQLWSCAVRSKMPSECPNPSINQDDVYSAFTRLFNKLSCHYKEILIPVQNAFLELKHKEFSENARVSDIQLEIAKLREQNHVLASLCTKGFLSSEKYQEQSAGLYTRISRLQKELFRLTRSDDEDESLEQLALLIDYLESHQNRTLEFDEDAFEYIVENIIVKNQSELEFHLLGGVHFTEYI